MTAVTFSFKDFDGNLVNSSLRFFTQNNFICELILKSDMAALGLFILGYLNDGKTPNDQKMQEKAR